MVRIKPLKRWKGEKKKGLLSAFLYTYYTLLFFEVKVYRTLILRNWSILYFWYAFRQSIYHQRKYSFWVRSGLWFSALLRVDLFLTVLAVFFIGLVYVFWAYLFYASECPQKAFSILQYTLRRITFTAAVSSPRGDIWWFMEPDSFLILFCVQMIRLRSDFLPYNILHYII